MQTVFIIYNLHIIVTCRTTKNCLMSVEMAKEGGEDKFLQILTLSIL